MTRSALAVSAMLAVACVGEARADGYPPFYGYSGYFGGPTVFFTPHDDVRQATTMYDGEPRTVTYYRGGPFYGYRPKTRRAFAPHRHHRRAALRMRG